MDKYHISVLLQETIDALRVEKNKKYIDATLGGGGHAKEIIERGGKVLGIDADEDAVLNAKKNYESEIESSKLVLTRGNFSNIDNIAAEVGFEKTSGILFDLGISSHHIDTAERGFSFQRSGPLDMRIDQTLSVSAKELVNGLTRGELARLFLTLGEEPNAKNIAEQIVTYRVKKQIETTTELTEIVESANKRKYVLMPKKVRAGMNMKVFQALRIAVNDELNVLSEAIDKSLALLLPGGRIAVITFHSLEDRIVKNAFINFEKQKLGTVITKKPIIPGRVEMKINRRSRSAKLRVFEIGGEL